MELEGNSEVGIEPAEDTLYVGDGITVVMSDERVWLSLIRELQSEELPLKRDEIVAFVDTASERDAD